MEGGRYPAGTQSPEDVPLWSYFGGDVPDHNRTKIGHVRFLTYFGSTIADIQLESGKIKKIPCKPILWVMVKLTSWVRAKDVPLWMRPWTLNIGPYGDVLKTSRRFSGTSSGRPWGRNFAEWVNSSCFYHYFRLHTYLSNINWILIKMLFIITVNLFSSLALPIFSQCKFGAFSFNFSLHISWIWINQFSPCQCLFVYLISLQEGVS